MGHLSVIQMLPIGRTFQNGKAFTIGLHHSVFDSVMDHLDKMAAACRTAVKVPLRGRQGFKDWCQLVTDCFVAAIHQAISLFKTPDTAADTHIDIMNTVLFKKLATSYIILVIGVAALNNNVAR